MHIGDVLIPASATLVAFTVAWGAKVVTKPIREANNRWDRVLTDLYGKAAEPGGVPAEPGSLERLGKVEATQVAHGQDLVAHGQRLTAAELHLTALDLRVSSQVGQQTG